MVAQVAADEPDTAAKMVQPMTLVCSSRPGSRSSQGARPLNMSSDSRVRNRISPIQTNSGSAVSVHDDAEPQIVTAIASPAGRDGEELHADPGDAGEREADPDAAAEQREQRDDEQQGDPCVHDVPATRCAARSRPARLRGAGPGSSATNSSTHGDEQHQRAGGHRELRNPQRRRVVAGRDVVELPRLPREAHAVEREQRAASSAATASAADLQRAARARRRGARGSA